MTIVPAATLSPTQTIKTKDKILLETAHNLGISSTGKTREQLTEEIREKVKTLGIA